MHDREGEIERLRQLVGRREESLKKAWRILQILREIIQASSNEAIPFAHRKKLDEEGMLIGSYLARELHRLHEGVNLHTKTLDQMWRSKLDLGTDTKLTRNRIACERFVRLGPDEVSILSSLAHKLRGYQNSGPKFEPPPQA